MNALCLAWIEHDSISVNFPASHTNEFPPPEFQSVCDVKTHSLTNKCERILGALDCVWRRWRRWSLQNWIICPPRMGEQKWMCLCLGTPTGKCIIKYTHTSDTFWGRCFRLVLPGHDVEVKCFELGFRWNLQVYFCLDLFCWFFMQRLYKYESKLHFTIYIYLFPATYQLLKIVAC